MEKILVSKEIDLYKELSPAPTMTPRLCIDCCFYVYGNAQGGDKCSNQRFVSQIAEPVRGTREVRYSGYCAALRNDPTACGPSGNHWEEAPKTSEGHTS
jgi:hypothetical protein